MTTAPARRKACCGRSCPTSAHRSPSATAARATRASSEPALEHLGTVLPNDYISRCVVSKVEKRPLSEAEILNVCLAFLTGGQETTTNLIGNLVWRLLEVPARWETLKADPA